MVNLTEWQKQNMGMIYLDYQLEIIRQLIADYATTCEELVEMHKTFFAQQDLAGVRLGNIYCDPLMTSAGHEIASSQRWTPTPVQLQIPEHIFDQGNGTPSMQKIKNRRARSKRRRQNVAPNNTESEVETEAESSKAKKTKPEELQSQHSASTRAEYLFFPSHEVCSDFHYLNPESSKQESMFPSDGSLKPTGSFGQMSVFDGMLSNSRDGYITGKMQMPGSYNLYQLHDGLTYIVNSDNDD